MQVLRHYLAAVLFVAACGTAVAADWSVNEIHYQRGDLKAPSFAGGGSSVTDILTVQHASGWGIGDLFFFVDFLDDRQRDGFNDRDYYGELYANFSLGKITGKTFAFGPLKDVGLLAGINRSGDARVLKTLPGVRLSWEAPGFAFLNTDLTAYLDHSDGVAKGGAPAENDSFMLDVNWAYPFTLGQHGFSIEGHAEYIGKRTNEFGAPVSAWLLAQPQLRWDLGRALHGKPNQLFLGIEYQYWRNKLGDKNTSESRPQFLAVWRF
jgi:nucleoside-specific outer membrane channel protein Tsx